MKCKVYVASYIYHWLAINLINHVGYTVACETYFHSLYQDNVRLMNRSKQKHRKQQRKLQRKKQVRIYTYNYTINYS